MSDLVAWLNACYDRAERVAKAAQPQEWYRIGRDVSLRLGPDDDDEDWVFSTATRGDAEYIASLDPAWRLADVGRKRKILAKYQGALIRQESHPDDESNNWFAIGLSHAVAALAEEFASEPGWQEEWRA